MARTRPGELPFRRLGEYEVLAPISEGGMASVWLGRSTEHPERVMALKVIRPEHARNKDFVAMFVDEARIASRLAHPNIIALHGLGHDGKRHFLAMEVLRGHSLLEAWDVAHQRGQRLGFGLIAWIGARIADALHHAHELRDERGAPQEVVHRDVNPSNIFLTNDGVPKLIDFGLAKARDRLASTAFGVVKGKLAYLAPEQVQGSPADRRSDVFALGVTLWELSLDRRLFREDSDVETVRRVSEAQVPDPTSLDPGYPPALAAALARALARNPAERFQTAADLRDALDAVVRESGQAIGETALRDALAPLFGDAKPAAWEALVDEATVGPERIRVWDDERQKLTWMNAAIDTVLPSSATPANGPGSHAAPAATTRREKLDAAIAERLANLEAKGDVVAIGRAHLERALVEEMIGDPAAAAAHAKRAVETAGGLVGHALLRRLGHARGAAAMLVEHLDAELADVPPGPARADLLAERARLLAASGASTGEVVAAWRRALDVEPSHPASLRGLDGALAADPDAVADRAAHLGRLAEASTAEPRWAAWLQVERAGLLDRSLGQVDVAKAALLRALDIDGRIGPVRAACVRHAFVHRDDEWAVVLLEQEAGLERDPARAAQLELDASLVARRRDGASGRAEALLERAVGRSPIAPGVGRRASDELVSLYTAAGKTADVLRVRRIRLERIDDPRARGHEHRSLAGLEENSGNLAGAVASLERALELTPDDATIAHDLDRLLGAAGLQGRRVELWTRLAATATPGPARTRCLLRAAELARDQGEMVRATELAKAALVAEPDSLGAIDLLLRLAPPSPREGAASAAERVAVHTHAAEHALDPARRIAHLESIALLQEEVLGDPAAAAVTYETVLRLEKGRRTALVGLARTAGRAGDRLRLSRALLDEAAVTSDARAAEALRVRAAETLPRLESERALAIVRDVLSRDPEHAEARRVEQSLHEAGERWARVDECFEARIAHAPDDRAKVDLWLARAEVQRTRLRAPRDAVTSLRSALALDPSHPAAREALLGQLEALGDLAALREALVEISSRAAPPSDRAALLALAAETEERSGDDRRASALLDQALEVTPDDEWLAERRTRLLYRRARVEGQPAVRALKTALEESYARSAADADRAFALAESLLDDAADPAGALPVLEGMLSAHSAEPHVLRSLERVARATGNAPLLANALAQQGEAFGADGPALGALWSEAQLVEWILPSGDTTSLVDRILRRAPADRAALDAALRQSVPVARRGDADGHSRVVAALRGRIAAGVSAPERLAAHLAIGLTLEPEDTPVGDEGSRAALDAYREALRIDGNSVVAAVGAARLGAALGDGEASVAGTLAFADVTSDPRRKSVLLVQAAGQTLSSRDERLGARPVRLARAAAMLERALDADPEGLPAIGLLVAVRNEEGATAPLLGALRRTFERAEGADAVVHLGGEVARAAAAQSPPDRVLAIEALRRVLSVTPGHGSTLRALAGHYVAQQAWGEAVDALEQLASCAHDAKTKLGALVDLADLYAVQLQRPVDADRVLRSALDVDPSSATVLRKLLAARQAAGAPAAEIRGTLERLADAETKPEERAAALTALAGARAGAGDVQAAEAALIEATALAPTPDRVAALLGLHPGAPADQARAMEAVVARANESERPDAGCLVTLGRLEIDALGRWPEGVAHLRLALALAPAHHEARASLAKGVRRMRGAAEALALLAPMLSPDSGPLLGLGDPVDALSTLEGALTDEGRTEEATVVRSLRVVAGGLDDGAHVALRARRLPADARSIEPGALDVRVLRAEVVPREAPSHLLDVAAALAGAEGKLVRVAFEDLGASPRSRLPTGGGGHPLIGLAARAATLLGLPRPEVAIGTELTQPRGVLQGDTPWLIVPEALLDWPEPAQLAAATRVLCRLALVVPWLDDLPGPYAHAVLCGAIRQVLPSYAAELGDAAQRDLIDDMAKRVAKAVGRKQRKALQELGPSILSLPDATRVEAAAFELAVARTELRASFLVTGDLLATLDVVRATEPELGEATNATSPRALAALLVHPVAGDVVRFALDPATLALRARAGSLSVSR